MYLHLPSNKVDVGKPYNDPMGNAPGFWYLLQPLFHEAKVMASHCVVEAQGSCPEEKSVCSQRWPKTDRCRHFCWVSLDPSYDIYRTLRLALDTS